MSVRQAIVACTVLLNVICGFALIYCGSIITPDHLPATWENIRTPGPLLFIAGCYGLIVACIVLTYFPHDD